MLDNSILIEELRKALLEQKFRQIDSQTSAISQPTVWKLEYFSAIQILREIKMGNFGVSKIELFNSKKTL